MSLSSGGTRWRWFSKPATASLRHHVHASAAEIFELGFNGFFRAQPLTSPVTWVYSTTSAPAFTRGLFEGRLSEADISNYRQKRQTVACAPIRIHG